jgi:phenylalanyl-tRNA synthetase beta chain
MIISLNWLKKFINIDVPVGELTEMINTRLVEIESVIDIGEKYKNILIVKAVDVRPLEGSDHLNIVKIDDGGINTDVERDENNLIQVVCGAPNISSGQMVVWLPPKSVVPQTFGTAEPFILDTRNLRGVISNGMIASAKELDLFDEHRGILVLDNDISPGAFFAKHYELDDFLLNIENKSLTHRPDCFGIIGFAREVSAILGKEFINPDWVMNLSSYFSEGIGKISVVIDDPNLSDRYQAIVMEGGDNKRQSPMIVQTYLARVGVRPISAIVDVTNYLMMLTGQPLHAFDFDKVRSICGDDVEIHVRSGRDDEELELLDGRVIKLSPDDIVVAAGDTAVALAGAMGGANTDIDENTRAVIIESATFNLYKLRSTQMRHGIFSEAITRFTKGQPAQLTAPVLGEAVKLVSDWAGMRAVTIAADDYPNKKEQQIIRIPLQKVNDILGTNIDILDAINPLTRAGFKVEIRDQQIMSVEVPYWRSDINIIEDVVEEIGRINGFDNIKSTLPMRDFTATKPSDFGNFCIKLRKILVKSGANEVLSYSFIHGDILQKAGQKPDNSYRLINSISPDLQYYRQTLTPSLLNISQPNMKQGFDRFAIFELNKTHQKGGGLNEENVPVEIDMLSLVVADKERSIDSQYYKAKRIFEYLCKSLGIEVEYSPLGDKLDDDPLSAPFEGRRAATMSPRGGEVIGLVGEYKKSVIKSFKLPDSIAGFEINTRLLFDAFKKTGTSYKPLSRYPAAERDVCFKVDQVINCGQIISDVNETLSKTNLEFLAEVIDIYQKEPEAKNVTIRIRLVSYDHTLNGDEVAEVINNVVDSVTTKLGAAVI